MKTVCVYHSIDLDGWMSAAIVKHWFKTNNNGYIKDTEDNFCDFIGYNYGQPIPDLSEYDKVIMCDISFPKEEMINLYENKDFIWLDHHISAINESKHSAVILSYDDVNGIRDTKFAACELTWKHFFNNKPMPEIVRLLGRYDCFGHKNTPEELKVLEFQYGARGVISNYEEAYKELIECQTYFPQSGYPTREGEILEIGKAIYSYLCTEAKQSYKNGFTITFDNVPDRHPMDSFVKYYERKFICINKERFNPINFGIDYHKDGYDGAACFHYANGKWNFSLYNDNGNVDCSAIAKQYGGGGHKGAAGFIIDNINDII